MAYYPPKVNARFVSPQFAGRTTAANSVGTTASFECGAFVRFSMRIKNETKVIEEARFQTNGCGFMTAAADLVAERLTGSDVTQLHAVDDVEFSGFAFSELDEFPAERLQCLHLVIQAVREALADYRAFLIEEFRGEKALICTCFGVSEETIEAYIAANSPETIDEVTSACRAGSGCGSCRMLIQEMIDHARQDA